MTDKELEVELRKNEQGKVDMTIYEDGHSMIYCDLHFPNSLTVFLHLSSEETMKLYAGLFKAFGTPFTIPDDSEES